MKDLPHYLYDHLISLGFSETSAKYMNMLALLLVSLLIILLIDFILRKILVSVFSRFAARSKTNFDDLLVRNKAPRNLAHVIPLLLAFELVPFVFVHFEYTQNVLEKTLEVFGIILSLWVIRSLLNTFKDYFKTLPNLKDKPVDSYIQVFMIFAWFAGFMLAFAVVTDTSVWKFFTALGAASAIIILIFRDTILGFVASIQVSINDMVRIGDWITFEKYGADGDVIEINLSTVKVQNFDKTITTIPTYALISDSFKNWRGMMNSEGRRIKRALIIKQDSVKFLSDSEVSQLKKIALIEKYL
ncbi:MAG: mechanosensitive ion channel, partial [Flavobacteriaceae bacterium]|nr:mechanosensitive ion channel [Flavobacteriaceae bacterium]